MLPLKTPLEFRRRRTRHPAKKTGKAVGVAEAAPVSRLLYGKTLLHKKLGGPAGQNPIHKAARRHPCDTGHFFDDDVDAQSGMFRQIAEGKIRADVLRDQPDQPDRFRVAVESGNPGKRRERVFDFAQTRKANQTS